MPAWSPNFARRLCLVGAGYVLAAWPGQAHADWRDDSGYTALQAELGAALPDGTGIPIMLSEASLSATESVPYLPQATTGSDPFSGAGAFLGKTITPHSGPSGVSNHARDVLELFCGTGVGMAPGVTEVHSWLADDFALSLYFGNPPPVFAGSVQNHSWAGSFGVAAADIEVLRKLDFTIARDGVTVTTPLNNGTASLAALLGNAYHSIAVGVRSGDHPHSQSTVDGLGRMKPDLVVLQGYTSGAGPCVAGAATLLLDAIRPAYPDADDPRVIKAILIAGASKDRLLGWQRTASTKPYDTNFGAGELNVLNAYRILAATRQPASDFMERSPRGWDSGTSSTSAPQRYFFTVPAGRWANTFSAAITWHRQFSNGVTDATLADLNLRLVNASGFVIGSTVDQSVSSIDNVEHLFLRNLPAGQYALEVTADAAGEVFGLAWEAQLGTGPTVTLQRDGSTNALSLAQLDPFKTYTVQFSADLVAWDTATTIRTADTTPATTAQWQETGSAARFYRLSWTP